jgi:hypothetical protein
MTSFGFSTGFHGLFLTGVRGCSGSSTVKVLLNGHGVFSNKSTFSSTSFSASTCAFSSSFSLGTSMRQYCGGRICRTNLPDPSTSQHCDFGSMGRKACEQFKKATDPGARYMLKGPTMDQSASGSAKGGVQSDDRYLYAPTAIVLSSLDAQGKVPGSSSTRGLPLLELGRAVCFVVVVNEMIRADGWLYRVSICDSEPEAGRRMGRLAARRGGGLVGVVDAILAHSPKEWGFPIVSSPCSGRWCKRGFERETLERDPSRLIAQPPGLVVAGAP